MKKNLFLITEDERERILSMHKSATKTQYLSEQQAPTTPAAAPTTPAAAPTTPAAAPTTPAAAPTDQKDTKTPENQPQMLTTSDKDYDYKKEGEKYFFKLKTNPVSDKAKGFKQSGKYLDWTEATGKGLESIKKLDFKPVSLSTKKSEPTPSPTAVAATTTTDKSQTPAGGGGEQTIIDPMADAKKTLPNIDKIDPAKAREVIAWSKTPSGQYVLNTPVDQRETALDNLDRRKGDAETRRLKKEIRQSLGMAADTLAGKVGSAIRGGAQGMRQGFRQQTT